MPAAQPATGDSRDQRRDWRAYDAELVPDPLQAALATFVRYGYHGTTVRMIATEAGLSVPGLYYHYASKQQMLVELLRMSNDDIMWRAQAALEEAGRDPQDRFVALVENVVLYMIHRQQLALVAHELRSLEEPLRSDHVRLRDVLQNMLRDEITTAAEAGTFATQEPRETSRAVLVMCRGVADWYRPGGPATPDEIAERYVRYSLAIVHNDITDS